MNVKHPYYKEKLRVEQELYELHQIQRNQSWIELEKPYIRGYYMVFDLRDDIKNRDDAWVFYECIRLVGRTIWWKNRAFKRKIKKGKYEYVYPGFGSISEETYESLHPAVKKYFSAPDYWEKSWNSYYKSYHCNVPYFFFVTKTEPCWVTHYKEYDYLIRQEEAEGEDYLRDPKFWSLGGWRGYSGAPKDFRKTYTRSDRRNSKQTIKRNIVSGGDDYDKYEYRYNHHHSARWDYW